MPDDVFIAINGDALFNKSKIYIGRALDGKRTGDFAGYQLWASFALELLGKALLARKHPSLVVDPNHWKSLFVAAGINITTDVKTIAAKTLFERLRHLLERFDATNQAFCQEMAERRNAELHSADMPFHTRTPTEWEARYWYVCDMILQDMESSLENWLGATEAKSPRQMLNEAKEAQVATVKIRVEDCRKRFQKLKKAEKERLATEANSMEPQDQGHLFGIVYDEIWSESCPSCGNRAFMAGEQTGEYIPGITGGGEFYATWEIVLRLFAAEEFRCPSCEFSATGSDEINAAGLDSIYEDEQEREIEYEPEYQNE